MQAVPLANKGLTGSASLLPSTPAAYEWSEHLHEGTLLAVGGGMPATVHLWNLQQERCMDQVCKHQS